jgi:hypothetical protein
MACQSSSLVRAAALRKSALSLAKSCSIGFRSGSKAVEDGRAGRGDRLADAVDLVRREIVEHHDVARLERRREELLDVGAKCGAGHWPVENQWRDDTALPQPGDEGGGAPVAVGLACGLGAGQTAVSPEAARKPPFWLNLAGT